MGRPLRTNPAYAHLAYKKSIITRTITFLNRTFLGDELTEPKEILVCEEVFPTDAEIPQEEIMHHVETLRDQVAQLDVQLRKFDLQPTEGNHEQKRSKSQRRQRKKNHQGGDKGGRLN